MDKLLTFCQDHQGLCLILLFTVTTVILAWVRRDRRLDSIPGPRGCPFIGIGFQLPLKPAAVFRKWALEYGDVFKIRVGWYNWVVINTPEAVREILEKQAVHTSSKAPSPMSHDIVTGGNRMPTMPYGNQWRALRTAVRQMTTVPATSNFIPSQEFEAKQLLFDLGTDNKNQQSFFQHMRRYALSIIMTNTFGTRVKTLDDPAAQKAIQTQAILRKTSRPGAFIVDEVPLLAMLPKWLWPGRKDAENAANQVRDIKMGLWKQLGEQVTSGKAPHCYAREIYEKKESWYAQGLTEEKLVWLTTGLVEAGFETTAATLNSLVLHLAASRYVQDKAHEELMKVVGPGRLPTFEDIDSLPYIRACVKEMMRINPLIAPGVRHFAEQDLVYKGHIIPKGTVLITNTSFLHYDPSRYEKPFEFMPERYLNHSLYSSEYAAMSDPAKRDHFTFSTGRRTCPGARLAENSLYIALAGVLWAYEIRPPLVNGTEKVLDTSDDAYTEGGVTFPKPFSARFIPRNDDRLRVVKEQWERAQNEGYELRGIPVDVNGMML
ncbi:Cytochrome P450 monooxygenase yanC [Talaromyces pinophilus]|nr:Cytochrome P450 monooxygenase yanC [Talaromyces pinophilus]